MFLSKIFEKPPKVKNELRLSESDLKDAISINRNSLKNIDNWIDNDAFKNSFFDYGVPDFIKEVLNKAIDTQPTYTDYIVAIANKYFNSISYYEIGVSVGKNFFQVMSAVKTGTFTGFDIEEINPVIEKRLIFQAKDFWPTPEKSIKKNQSSQKTYKFNGKIVRYLSADVWDENSWKILSGNKFNLVFSDALHSPEAILFEFEMLVKFDLLADKFVIFWDDLVGEMQKSFLNIIKKYNRHFKIKDVYLLNINGWVGQHEEPHTVGVISNFFLD